MNTDTSKKEYATNQGKDAAGNYALEREPDKKDFRSKEEDLAGSQKTSEKPTDKQPTKPNQAMENPQYAKETDKGEGRKDQPRS